MDNNLIYEEFRAQYEKQHPASVPILEVEGSPYPKWIKLATLIMFLAAALLSAVHTIPVVFESIPESPIISPQIRTSAANGSVIAFELGLLLSAFLMVSKSSLRLAQILLGTMFVGTLVANIYSISQTKEPNIGAIAVTIIFGAGIPVIALAAGKLYVNIYTMEASLEKRAKEAYREALKQWDAVIYAAWVSYQKTVKRGQKTVNQQVETRGKSVENSNGNYQRNATEIVEQFLREHPDAFQRSNRDIASELGVSHPIVGKVKNEFSNGNSNGHSE